MAAAAQSHHGPMALRSPPTHVSLASLPNSPLQLASTSAPTSVAARLVSPRQARRPPISANAAAAAWIPLQHAALLQTPTTA